ncbi:Basement membrane-specific heparan sulfate proteoglycan core protein [Echinococcus granulosus]|uniref:Basement membrane specific heparan sulfate n=1 Tax=Echinococcus granulosus TaxID=6210 RepID=A0A068WS81_ECHGR|nr:Basement membrane-specific heparan sulfate proteoglycan core protein [Echinococcus granulosus]CDS23005.1 basement membrane specific heparan sulfate [Echinococcus granulosus]
MRSFMGIWIVVFVLAFSLQSHAVLDEVISLGGGLDEPTIRLTRGETSPERINEGGTLESTCYLEDESEVENYQFTWVSRKDGTDNVISEGKNLYLTNVNADTFRDPIFCVVERLDDGEIFEKQIAVEYYGPTQPRDLEIRPMPSEDMLSGRVVRKCEVVPTPPPSEIWEYTWSDPSGRIISSSDILSITVTGEQPSVTYTCKAKNLRTNDYLIGYFTVHARNVPGAITYNTLIEPISRALEFGRPYEARCKVQPSPPEPVAYTWYFRNRAVSESDRLYLPDFNRNTAGEYICTARPAYNGRGRSYANATLNVRLKVTSEPRTELRRPPGSTLITNIGERRELHCEIPMNDRNAIRWYLNGTIIDANSPANRTGHLQRIDYSRVSIMSIDGIEENHEGQWECRTDTERKIVDVIVVSEYDLEVNPPLYVLDEGQKMEIHCSAQGAHEITNTDLEWFFRPVGSSTLQPLDYGPGGFVRTDDPRARYTSVITKYHVTALDEGEYVCREPRGQTGFSSLQIRRPMPHTLHITPAVIKVRPGQDVSLLCYSMQMDRRTRGPRPKLRAFDTRLPLRITDAPDGAVSGSVIRIDPSFNGTIIECFSDMPGVEPVRATIQVEDVCPPGYRRCRNGVCLEAGRFCDGNRDCVDGSDEDQALCSVCDPIVMKCETYRGQPPRKGSYMVHWQCDGEDDCGNGFDEANCQDPAINFCVKQQYTCPFSGLQIPRAFMCDSDPDCDRNEDEEQCREPQVLDAPRSQYAYRRGDTVTLTCEVAGRPNPRVIWRFNWGCLPDDGRRMTVRNFAENCGTPNEKTAMMASTTARVSMDSSAQCHGTTLSFSPTKMFLTYAPQLVTFLLT